MKFVHIDGLKIYTDKSTLFSKLEVRIITYASRSADVCRVNGMFLVHAHVYLPSTFGVVAIVTLSRLIRHANRVDANREDFACDTYK